MFIDKATNQIWVADAGNNRVLRFDVSDVTFKVNMPAAGVLGQASLITNTAGATASTMNNAFGIAVDRRREAVCRRPQQLPRIAFQLCGQVESPDRRPKQRWASRI